jgi:hypothetical protein
MCSKQTNCARHNSHGKSKKKICTTTANLHVANLSLDLFLGAVRTEPERQRDFVPIPLDVIDTTGTVVVIKAKYHQSPIINIEIA